MDPETTRYLIDTLKTIAANQQHMYTTVHAIWLLGGSLFAGLLILHMRIALNGFREIRQSMAHLAVQAQAIQSQIRR